MKDNLQIATQYKYDSISGRYVTAEHVDLFLDTLTSKFKITTAGYSVKNKNIKAIQFGEGAIKILVWSQMHGNESTATMIGLSAIIIPAFIGEDEFNP